MESEVNQLVLCSLNLTPELLLDWREKGLRMWRWVTSLGTCMMPLHPWILNKPVTSGDVYKKIPVNLGLAQLPCCSFFSGGDNFKPESDHSHIPKNSQGVAANLSIFVDCSSQWSHANFNSNQIILSNIYYSLSRMESKNTCTTTCFPTLMQVAKLSFMSSVCTY